MVAQASRALVPIGTSLILHGAIALMMVGLAVQRRPVPQQPLQVQVIDAPVKAEEPAPPPAPAPKPTKLARPARTARAIPTPTPLPLSTAPPAPTKEALQNTPQPIVITGITMESTSRGGAFAVGAGNTLRGAPGPTASAPETAKPYKAALYAASAQVSELPRPLNRDSLNLRKYYPPQAKKNGFEGDVVLRLLIDADGTIAKVDIVTDPGQGLGAAAAQAVRELRFSPAQVNGVAVATTVPFTIHFTLE